MSRLGQQDVGHEGVITGRDVLAFVPLPARSRVSGQQMFFARKRSGSGTDVGHEGVITGRDGFNSIANPQGIAQLERRSPTSLSMSL
ncbi:hypothetical protein FJQ98_07015 [Lysinibacillus agricola]|uniref:Peptidase C51 domain-containing protein n=1 Tax=Lysinibacillus agricola TaxID=2590012 RepID=A0ABX7AXG0_9BACI|nr:MULTISPECIES: hypothetical protein [Lysinibacillus]KOS62817.1 hypothetical protein AN161_10915 [Lysinibacillus sp. FJAT-14222]QQP13790.1 hypothetical protein FJQ98_07015 [Lysinibacillus agricola]